MTEHSSKRDHVHETCERCGTPMVWSDHRLVCPRRGCAGMSTAAGFTLTTDLHATNQGDAHAN